MNGSKRWTGAGWAIGGLVAAVLLGAYGMSIGGAERGSFAMNFPSEGGKPSAGPSARALTGSISVPLDSAGFIKRLLQPNVIEVASHSVRNVGATPRRIRFETTGFETTGAPVAMEWHSRDRAWNPDTHEIDRDLAPGQAVDFGLTVTLAQPIPAVAVPLQGVILVKDARTSEVLSQLAVKFERAGLPAGGDCCE
jgi:hypothetical protein